MRTIEYRKIVESVRKMCIEANCELPAEVMDAFKASIKKESSSMGRSIMKKCLKNAEIAREKRVPICQDTGLAVFFVKIGSDVLIDGGTLPDAINEGVKLGYEEGYLRKSSLGDPLFERKNTTDNLPAIIHFQPVKGSKLEITFAPKGGGAENMSRLAMLSPSAGEKGVIDFVVETVVEAEGKPCPPTVIGVGIGGTFERAALLAKKALLYPLHQANEDERYDKLEKKILKHINESGIGPQGLGGLTTSLAVHIEWEPCHLASLPVAVNVGCHAHRHLTIII